MRLGVLVLACLVLSGIAPAAIIPFYVDALNGSDANGGTTPATAWKTLTHALTVVGSPSTHNVHEIRLLPGVYDEANGEVFPIVLKQGRWLASTQGPAVTILGPTSPATAAVRVLVDTTPGYPTTTSAVRGLTLRGGSPCIDVDDSGPINPLQQYVVLEDLEFDYAPGPQVRVYQRNSSYVVLTRCHFGSPASVLALEVLAGEVRADQLAMDFGTSVARVTTISGSNATVELRRVRARGGAGVIVEPQPGSGATSIRLEDSYLSQTTTAGLRAVGAVGGALDVVVERSTIRGCLGGGVDVTDGVLTLHDSILSGSPGDVRLGVPAPAVNPSYCLIGDGTFLGQNGCIAGDPLLDGAGVPNTNSRAVDAADPASATTTIDLDLEPRNVDGDLDAVRRPDLGAIEFRPLRVSQLALGGTCLVQVFGPNGAPAQVHWTRGPLSATPYATAFGLVELQRDAVQFLTSLVVGDTTPGSFSRPVPSDPALVGRKFSFQARIATGGFPAEAWTNAVEITVVP